jgi:hypothetical protein
MSGLILYYIKSKNEERIKMIEHGINPDEGVELNEVRQQTTLKNAILLLSFGLGLIIAHHMIMYYHFDDRFVIYVSMLMVFGGIGFLISYLLTKSRKK